MGIIRSVLFIESVVAVKMSEDVEVSVCPGLYRGCPYGDDDGVSCNEDDSPCRLAHLYEES